MGLSDFHAHSTKSTTDCLEGRQTSLDTTVSSGPIPQCYEVDGKQSRTAELVENVPLTKTARIKRVCCLVKCKTRNAQGYGKFIILRLLSMHLTILQVVYQRLKIAAQIVTAGATVAARAASLTVGQRRRGEKQLTLNRVGKVRASPLA